MAALLASLEEMGNPGPGESATERENARRLVLEHGWNSTCYQLLNPGIEHWWSARGGGLVGFVRSGGLAIVAGAPVCAEADLPQIIDEWEAFAQREGLGVCYFGAEQRLLEALARSPRQVNVHLGSQPEWHPDAFRQGIQADASLRAQLNRARNKGVSVREWSREEAENHPGLRQVLGEWLAARGLPTLHFLVEPETLGDLRDRRLFVAETAHQILGFVTLCPVAARDGWLTEQFVRGRAAPNGTVELMLAEAARAVAAEGSKYFTMGIVPLVSLGPVSHLGEPGWLNFLRRWAKAHYVRFYNFRGLSEFKSKFHPERWQPVVVIVKAERFRISHLRAIARAFTRTSPELTVLQGIGKAVRAEVANISRGKGVKGR